MGYDTFGLFRGWCRVVPSCLEYTPVGIPEDAGDIRAIRCARCGCQPQQHQPVNEHEYDPFSPDQLEERKKYDPRLLPPDERAAKHKATADAAFRVKNFRTAYQEYRSASTDQHGSGRVSTGQHGSARVSTGQHGSARVSTWVSTGQHGSARVSTGQHRSARVSTGQHGSARVSTGQHGFGWEVPVGMDPCTSVCVSPIMKCSLHTDRLMGGQIIGRASLLHAASI